MQEDNSRDIALDGLRVIAIAAVILIHTTTRTLEYSGYAVKELPLTMWLNQAARFAVPLFIFISGFALSKGQSLRHGIAGFYKRRLQKVFIPYLFWSGIYYWGIYTVHSGNFFNALSDGSASYQLYFLITLGMLYAVFPIFYALRKVLLKPLIFILLTLGQFWLLRENYWIKPLNWYYPLTVAGLNIWPFMAGMLCGLKGKIPVSRITQIGAAIAGLGLAYLVYVEGRSGYLSTGDYQRFYTQWRPSIMIYTVAVLLACYPLFAAVKSKWIAAAAQVSFWVFFVHVAILEYVWDIWVLPWLKFHPKLIFQWWWDGLFFILVAGISYSLALLARRIKGMNQVWG